MDGTSDSGAFSDREIAYYRQRLRNRVFAALAQFFAAEAERRGLTKRDIAQWLRRDPALITRWLSAPGNLTLDTISDLLLALDAEMDPAIVSFADRRTPPSDAVHPLIALLSAGDMDANRTGAGHSAPMGVSEGEIPTFGAPARAAEE